MYDIFQYNATLTTTHAMQTKSSLKQQQIGLILSTNSETRLRNNFRVV